MRKMLLLACLEILLKSSGMSQNLISDPGFERTVKFSPGSHWFSANLASPDLLSPDQHYFGSSKAWNGRNSIGMILYDQDNPGYREYIACKLTQTLIKDTCYELTCRVRTSPGSFYMTDGFGFWIGPEIIQSDNTGLLPVKATWLHEKADAVADSKDWSELRIRIKANGGEQFLVLGNFKSDEQTLLKVNNRNSVFRLAYLQLDEIILQSCFLAETPGTYRQELMELTHSRKGNLFIPNVITPNADGFNDELFIPGLPPYTGIVILDSKGRELFREKSYQNNWGGEGLPGGKYHYELLLPDGNRIYGSFDLVRKGEEKPQKKPVKKRRR